MFVKHAGLIQLDTDVECRLPAEAEQDSVGLLLFDDLLDKVGIDGEKVYLVGKVIRGLDSCDVRVDEDRIDALSFEGLDRLTARIVEFSGLPYPDRSRSQEK